MEIFKIIASLELLHPPTLLAIFSFFLSSPRQVKVESDQAKLISDHSSSEAEDIAIEN